MNREEQLDAAIGSLPRISLGIGPTPLEPLLRLSGALGGPPIYMKRDDLTGLAFGGNKTRMLEFSIADAVINGADTIVTGMAVQSNYCRQLAAACAKTGLDLHLVLRPIRPIDHEVIQGNNLLQRLFGAHIDVLPDSDWDAQAAAVAAKADELRAAGKRVYVPRTPDTVDLDVIAYAESALEIVQQCRDLGITPRVLYSAAADTTQAGLVLGFKFLKAPLHVRGISPFLGGPDRLSAMVDIATRAAQRLNLDVTFDSGDFDNDLSYVGEGYGMPTPEGLAAIHQVARQEGVLLDPVYTGKAMAALLADVKAGRLAADVPVLFLHTGGAPALFGYADDIVASMPQP